MFTTGRQIAPIQLRGSGGASRSSVAEKGA